MQRFTRPESGPGEARDTAETEVRAQSEPPPKRPRPEEQPRSSQGAAAASDAAPPPHPPPQTQTPPQNTAASSDTASEAQAAGASQSETQGRKQPGADRDAPGFEAWVSGLSMSALEAAFDQTRATTPNARFRECQAFLCESIRPPPGQGCPGCPGCPWCRYRQALRYVLVHGRPPLWWSVP